MGDGSRYPHLNECKAWRLPRHPNIRDPPNSSEGILNVEPEKVKSVSKTVVSSKIIYIIKVLLPAFWHKNKNLNCDASETEFKLGTDGKKGHWATISGEAMGD